jgi:hypothetical protein
MQQMYAQLSQQLSQQVAQATSAAAAASSSNAQRIPTVTAHLPKIRQPSMFSGTIGLAVDHWLSEMNQQFVYYSQGGSLTTASSRIQYAAAYLDGIARQWWEQQPDRNTLNNWDEFVSRLHTRFRPIQAAMLARQKLDKLRMREGNSVNAYIGAFHSITMPIVDMSESDRIHAFARGLSQRLAAKVWERNPQTLQDAIDYAVTAEATGVFAFRGAMYGNNSSHSGSYRSSSTNAGNHGSAPMDLSHIAVDEFLAEEAHSDTGLQVLSSTAAQATSTSSRLDVEALIQAAVEQRVNAMMSSNSSSSGGFRSNNHRSAGAKNRIPGLTSEEIAKLMKENKCFRCKQVGHRKDDPKCPKNSKSKNE